MLWRWNKIRKAYAKCIWIFLFISLRERFLSKIIWVIWPGAKYYVVFSSTYFQEGFRASVLQYGKNYHKSQKKRKKYTSHFQFPWPSQTWPFTRKSRPSYLNLSVEITPELKLAPISAPILRPMIKHFHFFFLIP